MSYLDDEQNQRVKSTSTADFNELNLIPYLGAGIEFQLNSRMCLHAMPTIRYGAIDIIKESISSSLFSYGVQFGWMLNLEGPNAHRNEPYFFCFFP